MTWIVEAAVAAKVGFATHQNAIPIIRTLKIAAPSETEKARDLVLTLSADPPFVQAKTWRIDAMASSDEIEIADRDVALDATLLHDLTESITGTLSLSLADGTGTLLAQCVHPVELLAHNQWGGVSTMAELLPAFVMPNDPAVDKVLKAASDVLRRAGKPDAFDGYQSGKRERVWETASALWSAVAGLRLSYALPPANFERTGQKVRTPSQILAGGVATCLNTALLFAAALEQASLNPLLVLTAGHAFVGVWLQPVEFAALVTDEAAAAETDDAADNGATDEPDPDLILDHGSERPEPIYARAAKPITAAAAGWSAEPELYRATTFKTFEDEIDPLRFYETSYDDLLGRLVAHVLRFEAPIAESLLVQRIARAHGFQRAGRVIRDRVMAVADREHFVQEESSGGRFVWSTEADCTIWGHARAPASVDDIRQIEDISLAEIRTARNGRGATEVARLFGVRRLTSAAKTRIDSA